MSENNYQLSYTGAMVSSLLDKANLITVMSGATSSQAGSSGFVPAPASTDVGKFLKGDGTWATPSGGGGGGGSSISYTTLLNTETYTDKETPFSMSWSAPSHGYLNILFKNLETSVTPNTEIHWMRMIPIEYISSIPVELLDSNFRMIVSSSSGSLIIENDWEDDGLNHLYLENITQVSFS